MGLVRSLVSQIKRAVKRRT